MAKDRKPKPALRKPFSPEQLRARRQVFLNTSVLLIMLIGGALGYSHVRQYVEHKLTFPLDAPRVVLKHRPVWMSDFLAEQIIGTVQPATAESAFKQQMLADMYDMLKRNPWVREVHQIRRAYGKKPGDTIEVDCDYRAPIALVRFREVYALVDSDGVRLPELFNRTQIPGIMFGRDNRVNIRVIEGVSSVPPEMGHKWDAPDLMAGLEMVQLLYGKPYTEQLQTVRVHNFRGRVDLKEAELVLTTRDGTEVRWGRPASASSAIAEVPWSEKLKTMERIVEKYHRIDAGHSSVDIRFDKVTFPSEDLVPGERSAGLRQEP